MKENKKDFNEESMSRLLEIEVNLCKEVSASRYDCEVSKARNKHLSNEVGCLCYEITEASKKMRNLAMEADDVVVMDDVRLEIVDLTEKLVKLAKKYSGVVKDYTKNLEEYAASREKICEKQMELGEVQSMIRKKATEEGDPS